MRVIIRTFFRGLRLVLAPILLAQEKLSTPKGMSRTPEAQAEVDAACQGLALYQFQSCPFCIKVRKEIARLNLAIDTRDAKNDPTHREALAEGGGRVKVPCLRIEQEDGKALWLYESSDINRYLNQRFGAI
ncbi:MULTISPECIES: glutaredoxin [unclassified Halomonas]|uniref:glutaredoxin family protein n=1 Tax=unclassified Halomonas TaxID=2609666 RepID=UPI00209CE29E|nr:MULTISPECIES: glutaredoxin [unclassified Halomonas]MCP1313714.1 glutaredoxin [Halomonas sp. 707D7]MCP1327860.1 glutaredoxin [Halomonas sp. 707D4]